MCIPKSVKKEIKLKKNSRRRDHFVCKTCGNFENIQSHHIIPVRMIEINETWNYITMCDHCHEICDLNQYIFDEIILNKLQSQIEQIFTSQNLINHKFTELKKIYIKNNFDFLDIIILQKYFNIIDKMNFQTVINFENNKLTWESTHDNLIDYLKTHPNEKYNNPNTRLIFN